MSSYNLQYLSGTAQKKSGTSRTVLRRFRSARRIVCRPCGWRRSFRGDLGLRIWKNLELRVQSFGFGVQGVGCRIGGTDFLFLNYGLRFGFRVKGLGYRV